MRIARNKPLIPPVDKSAVLVKFAADLVHFNFELNYFQFPSVVQFSSNDPTIWSDRVDLINVPEAEASEGIDAEIAQIIAPTQRQYRVVSVESRT